MIDEDEKVSIDFLHELLIELTAAVGKMREAHKQTLEDNRRLRMIVEETVNNVPMSQSHYRKLKKALR